jgi:hypothetical protein
LELPSVGTDGEGSLDDLQHLGCLITGSTDDLQHFGRLTTDFNRIK